MQGVKAPWWERLRYHEDGNGCWVWEGSRNPDGYAKTQNGSATSAVHVLMWERENGPVRGILDHRCRNHACIRPSHLEDVTVAENNRRGLAAKVRGVTGEIRRRYAAGELQRVIAAEYGITQSAVSLIVNRKRWVDE